MTNQARIDSALARLREGNDRFSSGLRSAAALASFAKLAELAENGQAPFASILTCADSRVPTEMVFDCGLGDLFVCRVAGNVATSWMVASLEYAAVTLKTPLCVVLGHTRCGAVSAAYHRVRGDDEGLPSRHLERLADAISPAVKSALERAGGRAPEAELLRITWEENVRRQMDTILEESEVLRELRRAGSWELVGAVYDLATGRVAFSSPKGEAVRS